MASSGRLWVLGARRLAELVAYRDLMWNLVVRDLKVRYRNSALGFVWSLLSPLLMMAVFTIVFTVLMPQDIRDFPVFIFCALLPWNFFSSSVMGSIGSIVGNGHLIQKVRFPRELLPASVVLSNLVNFLFALPVLFGLIVLFRIPITPLILLLPLIILLQTAFVLGLALGLSCVNVFFRDTAAIMEVLILAWFFLTPIFYPIERLPHHYQPFGLGFEVDVWRWMYILNPMASLISSYRLILYYGAPPDLYFLSRTLFTAVAFLMGGYLVFSRYSRLFAEEV